MRFYGSMCIFFFTENADCVKSEQDLVSWHYALIPKYDGILLRIFYIPKGRPVGRLLIILYDQFDEATHRYLILPVQFPMRIHQTNFVQDAKKLYLYHLSQFDVHLVQLLQ